MDNDFHNNFVQKNCSENRCSVRRPLNMNSPVKCDITSQTGKFPVHDICQHTLSIDVVLNINIQGRQRLTQPQVLGCVIQGNTATR